MKRTLSAALIFCTLSQPAAPAFAQQPTASVVTITSMDRGAVRPFDRLVISGSGFQPDTAAISVLFVPKQHGLAVVIPAFSASPTRVEVIVPTFLDPTSGDFGFGQADVQIVQVTRDNVMSSNVLAGLDVAPVPSLPDSVGTGRVTRAFMRLSRDFLSVASDVANPEARASFAAFKDDQAALLALVEGVVANPASTAFAATAADSAPFVVDAAMLKASDRLIAAYLTSLEPLIDSRRSNRGLGLIVMQDENCQLDSDIGWVVASFCNLRSTVLGDSRDWATGVAVVAAIGGTAAALCLTAPLMVGLGFGIAGVAVSALALQMLYVGVSATIVPSFLAADAPPLLDTLKDHTARLLDDARARGNSAIAAVSATATDAAARVAARTGTARNPSPKGGSTFAAAGIDASNPVREMSTVQGSGTDAVLTKIGVSSTQATRTFFEARIAPPAISAFDGNYSGTMTIIDTKFGADTLGLRFTVAAGTVTITSPFSSSGPLSAAGRFQVAVDGCPMIGTLETKTATGRATGGGVIPMCNDGHGTGWGMWEATRTAQP